MKNHTVRLTKNIVGAFVPLIAAALVRCGGNQPPAPDSPEDATYVKDHGQFLLHAMNMSNGAQSIWVTHASGSDKVQLMQDAGSPSWTPDGRVIFVSKRSGSQQIWIMNADGGNARQVGNLAENLLPLMPQLGRNGVIVFMGRDEQTTPDGNTGIYTMQEDGSGLTKLTRGMQPSLAVSGTWVAFTLQTDEPYHREIWRIDSEGTGLKQLTFLGDPDYPDANAPNISPDEESVAFFSGKESARAVPGAPPESIFDWGYRNVATVPADGGPRRTLTPCHFVRTQEEVEAARPETGTCIAADNPAWSPDGHWLVFDIGFVTGTQTWMVDTEGNNFQSYYTDSRGIVRVPLRYPDGT